MGGKDLNQRANQDGVDNAKRGIVPTPTEEKLLDFFRRELRYGEARVIVKNGQPVFVRIAFRDVKLD